MNIPLDGEVVQVDSDGSGPDLVMIHSLLTDARAFDPAVPALARDHTVHRVSLPGFGSSTPLQHGHAITIDNLADRIAGTMEVLGCSPSAAVLGNGLGAFVSVALAERHGPRFGPLIVANGGAGFTPERKVAFETMSGLVSTGGMEAVVDVAVRRIFSERYLQQHPGAVEERRRVLLQTDPGSFAAMCAALADLDLRPGLTRITNPTLVLGGSLDQATPPDMAQELADGIPGAELVLLDDCGHCPSLEQPDAFVDVVSGYLAGVT